MNTRQFLNMHGFLHALAKSATAEGIEFLSLSGRVWKLIAELSASTFHLRLWSLDACRHL